MLNKFLSPLICGFTLLTFSPSEMHANWEELSSLIDKPLQGPPGPVGKQGESGKLAHSYASVKGGRQLVNKGNFFSVHFGTHLLSAVGIEHPAGRNDTIFRVKNGGIYLIQWSITSKTQTANQIRFNLLNVKTLQEVKPISQMVYHLDENEVKVISGQSFAHLSAGDAFQFEIFCEEEGLEVMPTLNVMRITP